MNDAGNFGSTCKKLHKITHEAMLKKDVVEQATLTKEIEALIQNLPTDTKNLNKKSELKTKIEELQKNTRAYHFLNREKGGLPKEEAALFQKILNQWLEWKKQNEYYLRTQAVMSIQRKDVSKWIQPSQM